MGKKLPKNWVGIELKDIIFLKNGNAFKKKEYVEDGIPIIRMSDLVKGNVSIDKSVRVKESKEFDKYTIEKGDLLIGMSGSIGKYGIFDLDCKAYLNQRVGNLRLFSEKHFNKGLLKYAIIKLQEDIVKKAYGGAVPNISSKLILDTKLDMPPLAEQERIVAKLDNLFTKLDKIKSSLATIPELLQNFRQQVLTQAVTGKLTEEWRKEKKILKWENQCLKQFSDTRLGKMLDKNKNKGELIDYLRNANIRWFRIDFDDIYQLRIQEKEKSKFELKINDVLVCEGGEPGRAAIWKYDRTKIIFQKALHRVRLNGNVIAEYFLYNLWRDAYTGRLNKHFTGTTIKHLTGREFAKYSIAIPPIEEQQEIVNRVESLFAKANRIQEKYEFLKANIEQLPQAILNKAFKGELVPQLESDGDARELLKEIEDDIAKTKTGKL